MILVNNLLILSTYINLFIFMLIFLMNINRSVNLCIYIEEDPGLMLAQFFL